LRWYGQQVCINDNEMSRNASIIWSETAISVYYEILTH